MYIKDIVPFVADFETTEQWWKPTQVTTLVNVIFLFMCIEQYTSLCFISEM